MGWAIVKSGSGKYLKLNEIPIFQAELNYFYRNYPDEK